jgi:hypothetical protein
LDNLPQIVAQIPEWSRGRKANQVEHPTSTDKTQIISYTNMSASCTSTRGPSALCSLPLSKWHRMSFIHVWSLLLWSTDRLYSPGPLHLGRTAWPEFWPADCEQAYMHPLLHLASELTSQKSLMPATSPSAFQMPRILWRMLKARGMAEPWGRANGILRTLYPTCSLYMKTKK